jgi:hypothetical protein
MFPLIYQIILLFTGFFCLTKADLTEDPCHFPPVWSVLTDFMSWQHMLNLTLVLRLHILKKLRCRNEMLKNQISASYGGKDEI